MSHSVIAPGLQVQSSNNRLYTGPLDAVKKIYSAHGIQGIYKGQVATLTREAVGYGAYFWAYEKLMQREMAKKGIRREDVSAANAVLYGAAAGYAVSRTRRLHRAFLTASALLPCFSCGRVYTP